MASLSVRWGLMDDTPLETIHISFYIAIAVNSFITSMAVGNMFQTFKYNCILYCTDVVFEKEMISKDALPKDSFLLHSLMSRDVNSLSESEEIIGNAIVKNSTNLADYLGQNLAENDMEMENMDELENVTFRQVDNVTPDKNSNVAVYTRKSEKENGTIVFKNETHIFQNEEDAIAKIYAKIDVRKSSFASNFWCHFVLGIALVTFIFATFCTVLMSMCSKGGRGRNNTLNRPQNMVYPIVVSSILLGILNFIAAVAVKNGMKDFCANFEIFTGQKSCTPLLNKFTLHERQGNFYLPYVILEHTFSLTVIFFMGQLVVTLLRVIYAVDYQLYALETDNTEEEEQVLEIEDGRIVKERQV